MARREQQIGKAGEQLAENRLRSIGLEMIEKIGTPVRLIPLPEWVRQILRAAGFSPNGVFRVIFGETVSGDRRAIIPGAGTSVLIETKTILDRNLRWSDLRDHQPDALSQHASLGGISLLVWVHIGGVFIMRWPIPDFAPRCSIDPAVASLLNIESIKEL